MGARGWAKTVGLVLATALIAIITSLMHMQAAEAKPRACRVPQGSVSCSPPAAIASSRRSLPPSSRPAI